MNPLVDLGRIGKAHGVRKVEKYLGADLNPIVESISWMSPATITWLALPIGILGGLSVFLASEDSLGVSMLFGGGLLITLAMAFDGLDGPVARATGRVTRWGDYLDHTFDRLLRCCLDNMHFSVSIC